MMMIINNDSTLQILVLAVNLEIRCGEIDAKII